MSVLPQHLAHVPTVAQAVPELRLVIDHLSKPPIASGELGDWRRLFAAAAEHPNVNAKVSGLDTAAKPGTWTVDDLRPAFDHALETLGPDRLMYGGDWPISILGGGYPRQHAAFMALIAELSRMSSERSRVAPRSGCTTLEGDRPLSRRDPAGESEPRDPRVGWREGDTGATGAHRRRVRPDDPDRAPASARHHRSGFDRRCRPPPRIPKGRPGGRRDRRSRPGSAANSSPLATGWRGSTPHR